MLLMSRSEFSIRYCWIPSHTVGTPADTVTRSSSMRSTIPGADRSGPGMTILAPTVVAMNVKPHAAAWNCGTTGSSTSDPYIGLNANPDIVCR